MTDIPDWEKQYWQQKIQQKQQGTKNPQDLPHFEPAHVTQDKHRATGPNGQWQDVDPMTAMYTNAQGMSSRGMGPQVQTVYLREGATVYRAVQAESFGSTVPLVRNCGPTQGVGGKEFEMRGACSCYVIDSLEVIDMGNLDSKRSVQLVELRAPWIGTVLVEKNSILSSQSAGLQVLKG